MDHNFLKGWTMDRDNFGEIQVGWHFLRCSPARFASRIREGLWQFGGKTQRCPAVVGLLFFLLPLFSLVKFWLLGYNYTFLLTGNPASIDIYIWWCPMCFTWKMGVFQVFSLNCHSCSMIFPCFFHDTWCLGAPRKPLVACGERIGCTP